MPEPREQRYTSANEPRPRLRALRKRIQQRSHRDEETARFYLSRAAERAKIIQGKKERVVIDLGNLAANTNQGAVRLHIISLAPEYGLEPARKPTDNNLNKLYFRKIVAH